MKTKVILDVDTGTDDAVAILLAALCREIELVGVCSVNGNKCLDFTTENTLRVLDLLGAEDVPMNKGCPLPIVATLTPGRKEGIPNNSADDANTIHSALLPIPEAKRKPDPVNAVTWLVETFMASDNDITLVPLGPLTNVALAMRIEPEICKKIKEIIIMGGGHNVTNHTPTAEFNFWADPEAAKIVMESGCKITLVPLDATHKAQISIDNCKDLRAINTPAANLTADVVEHRIKGYNSTYPSFKDKEEAPLHDALALAAVVRPEVLRDISNIFVDIDCSGGPSDGRSICDYNKRITSKNQANCNVALDADKDLFIKFMKETLALPYICQNDK